jgi:predicted metalloendopeptidase
LSQGRQFDKDGNLVEWWEPDTKKKYLLKAKCIIEQYGNYTEEETGMHVSCSGLMQIKFFLVLGSL